MRYKLLVAVFLFSFSLISQTKVSISYSNLPLSDVIIDIEKRFNIKLSYNASITNNKFITLNFQDAFLDEILMAIEDQANVKFKKESDRYYTIKESFITDLTRTQHLQEIFIKEYVTMGISKENNDASISLSPKRLGILPGLTEPDVLQSLQLLPGVQSPTETASGLYIRGGTPDQNLILWDGIKMYYTGHFFGTISAFNPYITEDIRLYKNGTKAKYGSRISGVIDITSDNDIPNKTEGGMGFNMTHADVYVKTPITNKTALMVSARRSINDIFETLTFKNLSDRVFQDTKISEGNKVFEDDEVTTTKDLFYFTDFTVKAVLKPNEKNEFAISNLITKNKLDYGFLIEEFNEASQDKLDINNQGSSVMWNHSYNKSFSQNINAYYSRYDLDYTGSNSIENEFSDQLDKENRIDDFGVSYGLNWNFNEKSSLGLGYQYSLNEVKYSLGFQDSESPEENFNQSNTVTNNTHAIYGDYHYKIADKWFMNFGLRTNYFSVLKKPFFEPRLQLETKITNALKFKLSGEILHQVISQVVEFNTQEFGLENQIWILSDGNQVPLLKSTQFTAGFIFNKNGWNIDVEGYCKSIEGLTSLTLGFGNEEIDETENSFFAKGKSNVLGLDVFIKKKIGNYRTWLSYSIIDNEFTFQDINNGIPFPGNSDIRHQLSWSHTYDWNHFNISMGWTYRTGIPYTKALGIINTPNGSQIEFDDTNGDRLPDYHRLDISTTYEFNMNKDDKWKGKIGMSLLNIYDEGNILSRTYEKRQSTTENKEVIREINKTSIGITPNVVFRVEF